MRMSAGLQEACNKWLIFVSTHFYGLSICTKENCKTTRKAQKTQPKIISYSATMKFDEHEMGKEYRKAPHKQIIGEKPIYLVYIFA